MRIRLVAAALLVTSSAGAWSRRTTETDIVPALVHGKLEGTTAVFTARYVIPVAAPRYMLASAGVDLPTLGIVTAAIATTNGVAHPLGMLPAEDAATKFATLSSSEEGVVAGRDKTNAVTISGSDGRAEIGLAAAHAGVITIDMTIVSPTCFYRDARYVSVPAAWRKTADRALRKVPIDAKAVSAACGTRSDDPDAVFTSWIGFPAPDVARKPSGDRVGAVAARLPLGEEHIVRVELSLAGELGDVPRDLATVLLVDGSRSMSPDEAEAQRQLVASYLRAAPASRVQVLSYARRTVPLLPGWTTAAQAAARVDRGLRAIAPRNGSNFDVALADAATWLDRIQGTRRIVLFTDERMAERLDATSPTTLKRLVPPGTLVQVVAVDAVSKAPRRDETARLAPLAAATDGMAVRAGPLDEPLLHDATLLVRPISMDRIHVKAPGWEPLEMPVSRVRCGEELDELLHEGESCTWWGEGDTSSGPVVVEGLVWGKRVQRLLRPDANRARDVARELSARESLDEKLRPRVDEIARAVNSHWSLYVQWGGRDTYDAGVGFGMTGGSGGGCGCDASVGPGGRGFTVGVGRQPLDLATQLRPLLAACHVESTRVSATLEMTFLEIVDLTVNIDATSDVPAADRRKQQTCVEDALWDAAPMLRRAEAHASYNVSFEPKR